MNTHFNAHTVYLNFFFFFSCYSRFYLLSDQLLPIKIRSCPPFWDVPIPPAVCSGKRERVSFSIHLHSLIYECKWQISWSRVTYVTKHLHMYNLLMNAVHDWEGEQLQATWREIPILHARQVSVCPVVSSIMIVLMSYFKNRFWYSFHFTIFQAGTIYQAMGWVLVRPARYPRDPQHLDLILVSGQ